MNVCELRLGTVDQYHEICLHSEDRVVQLSPGPLDFRTTMIDLPGMVLEWNGVGARIRSRETYLGAGVLFGFALYSPAPLRSFGRELGDRDAVIWQPGVELDYIAPSGLRSLIVHVDEDLVDVLGWTLGGGLWQQVPKAHLTRLERTCRMATRAARRADGNACDDHPNRVDAPEAIEWRDRILVDLEAVLGPWRRSPPAIHESSRATSCFRLVRDAERFMDRAVPGEAVAVDALAEALGVSRRAVFHGFREWLGLSPLAYFRLVKLHRLRDRLLAGSPASTSVTELAIELGFTHMGRLAAAYRQHFGEHPSETLKRR